MNKGLNKKQYERPVIQRLNAGVGGKFGLPNINECITHIDGNKVSELIASFGSPLFILSEKQIRNTYRDAHRAFTTRYPKFNFAWSYKTNYLPAVCNIFHQEGSWAEVVSGFEYQKAIRNGVPGNKIIFNGPDKKENELREAIEAGSLIHIDHLDELETIQLILNNKNEKARVAIRINLDAGIYPNWDRFGFNYENGEAWQVLEKIMKDDRMELKGLHCHIGTFILSSTAYGIAAAKLSLLAIRIRKQFNHRVDYLDLGGGFASKNTLKGSYLQGADACPGFEQYADAISTAILSSGIPSDELPQLILETGRALIDEAGFLAGTVIALKRLADGRRATVVDFGVNILFSSFWYDHQISPAQEGGSFKEETAIYGPLCMNIDLIREYVSLPALNKGDQLVVHSVGAYNMTQWMQFINLRPAVVLIDEDEKAHLIRKAETNATLEMMEVVPQHLTQFNIR